MEVLTPGGGIQDHPPPPRQSGFTEGGNSIVLNCCGENGAEPEGEVHVKPHLWSQALAVTK